MKRFIKCKQVVEYYQEVDVTEKECAMLESVYGDDVSERDLPNVFAFLQGKIDHADVFSANNEYLSVEILKK